MGFFNNLSVRIKLLAILVLFALLPMAVLFGINKMSEGDYEKSYAEQITGEATNLNEIIDRNLFERYGDVQAFGLNTSAWDEKNWKNPSKSNPLIQAINGYIVNYGFYEISMLVDLQGNVLAVNSVDAGGKDIDTAGIYKMNFADAAWFKDAKEGKFVTGKEGLTGTAIQHPYREKIVADAHHTDGYVLALSAQVKNGSGQQIGVWVNFMNFDTVANIIVDKAKKLSARGMDHTEMDLLDDKGNLLFQYDPDAQKIAGLDDGVHYNFDQIGKRNFVEEKYAGAAEAVEGKSGSAIVIDPDTKVEQIAGYNHSDGELGFPGLGWSMIIAPPKDVVLRVVDTVDHQMSIALVVCVVAFGGLALLIGTLAASPIQLLTKVMGTLAGGDKTVAIPLTAQKDELGSMARTLEVFKNNLIESERMQREQAELERKAAEAQQRSVQEKAEADRRAIEEKVAADQRAEADRKAMMRKLADDFENSVGTIVSGVASAATELRSNAEGLTRIASNTNSQAATVATATEEASVSVQTVSSSAEELSSSIAEISRQINESTRITQQAVEKSRQTNETMTGLSSAAEKIGDVVKLIQDIAGQTNLLALNATIEAARAGDAGKGFAVVASEVKNLANQTEKATGEISEQISGIQQVSQTAVVAIQEIGSIIERINEITAAVAAAVEEQTAATQEIARNTEQASAGTREVASSIIRVSEGAQESGAASNQLLSASSELSVQAEKLRQQMTGFLNSVRAA